MNQLSGKFEVKIGKKKYKCHLSMNAFRLLCEAEELEFKDMQKWMNANPLTSVPKVIYYGLLNSIYFTEGSPDQLPSCEYVSAHVLENMDDLTVYSKKISKAFGGEDKSEPGKK